MEIKRLEPGKRMSEAVVYNHVAYLAGQIPEDTSKGPLEQTREVLAEDAKNYCPPECPVQAEVKHPHF